MLNLNQQISDLITAIEGAGPSTNTLLVADQLPTFLTNLKTSQANVTLSAEELAASGATVERIETEEIIDRFIRAVKYAYQFLHGTDLPDWIKRGMETTVESYTEFFDNLATADTEVLSKAQALDAAQNIESVKTLYAKWQELKAKETLQAKAVAKVRNAIDLRACLIGILRYLGTTGSAIADLLPTEETAA